MVWGGLDVSDCSVLFPFLLRELKLRNYEPEDEELKKRKVPQAKPASGGCKQEHGR